MKRFLKLTLIAAMLSGCASSAPQSELYPHPPGSMGHPNARATVLTGVTVLLLSAVVLHSLRDK